jgi:hypothetical protein
MVLDDHFNGDIMKSIILHEEVAGRTLGGSLALHRVADRKVSSDRYWQLGVRVYVKRVLVGYVGHSPFLIIDHIQGFVLLPDRAAPQQPETVLGV